MDLHELDIEQLREAYHAQPEDSVLGLELAQRFSDKGWFNEALDVYSSLMQKKPDDATIFLEFGNTLFKKGDLAGARKALSRFTEMKPDRIEGWNNLGIVQLQLADIADAHASFEKVLSLEPGNLGALLNLGNCLCAEGNAEAARSCFEKACTARPDLPDGWYNLGNTCISLKKYTDARQAFEKALRYRREFPSALKNLGWVYEYEGRLTDAEICYQEALAIQKADPTLYVNLGNVLVRQKKYDEAKQNFLKAVRLAPHELNGWMGLRSYALAKGDVGTFVRATMAVVGRLSDETLAQSIDILYELNQIDKADQMLAQAERLGKKSDLLDIQRLLLMQRQKTSLPEERLLLTRLTSQKSLPDAVSRGLARYHLNAGNLDETIAFIHRIKHPDPTALGIVWRAMLGKGLLKETRKQIREFNADHKENYDTYFLLAAIEGKKGNMMRAETLLVYALDHGFSNMEEIHANPALHQLFESMTSKKQYETVVPA